MFHITYYKLIIATLETLKMISASSLIASGLGLPIAIILYLHRPQGLSPTPWLYQTLSGIVNIMRSIPFVILLVMILPLNRFIIHTTIGADATILPLSIAATPFIAKLFQNALEEIPQGLIESGIALGASRWQLIWRMVLPEALPGLINALTVTAVTLVGYAVMAGAIVSGGLGELAYNYGYQRFDIQVMLITMILLIILVQFIQMLGDWFSRRLQHA